jgi:Calcineurin-like phosphoesterase
VIADVVTPGFLSEHLRAIRAAVDRGVLDQEPGLPLDGVGPPSSGGHDHGDAQGVPFLGRDPYVSLMQTSIEQRLRAEHPDAIRDERDVDADDCPLAAIAHAVQSLVRPERFSRHDPRWILDIAAATFARLRRGNHAFNPVPAEHALARDARVVLVGDWGTGLPRARAVAAHMREEVADALAHGREVHVVHLGDVYYSGDAAEYDERLLADGLWPIRPEEAAAGAISWSLNGNHDMYSGGWDYFDHLLAERRFTAQRSPDGRGTSFFRLTSPDWELVGLDTSWERDPLSLGQAGALEDPQAAFVEEVAGASQRKLMLLSHHQLVSVYEPDDLGDTLLTKLGGVLDDGRVTAWFWGHEHRCMAFEPSHGVALPRCLGNGGVPVVLRRGVDAAVPPPGLWEERGFLNDRGEHWGRFGFAVLDLDGPRIAVRYRDDLGRRTRAEVLD